MAAEKLNYITADSKSVVIGSGELYAIKHTAGMNYGTVTTESMTDLGFIQANAVLKAKAETKDLVGANCGIVGTVPLSKEVTFETGIMEWNLDNVSKFLTGSDYSVVVETGVKKFYYGDADKAPDVMLRFVAEDEATGKRITVDIYKCNFSGELSLDFNNDDPITFDYSFKVLSTIMPNTKRGYFLVTEEDIV